MKSEWRECSLGDIVSLTIDHRGLTPKKLGGDWAEVGFRALSAKNVKTGKIVQTESIRYVNEEMYHRWMPEEIENGDILVTSEAPFGEIYQWNSDEKIVLSQRLFGLRVAPTYDADYVYYYMTTDMFKGEMHSRATGTTVIGLRQPELLKCKILFPDINIQKKISSVLRTIDKEIEVNDEVNKNLKDQAQAIYVDMFITHADPSWPLGHLSDLITVRYGKDHKKLNDGPFPVYGSGGIMRYVERPIYEKESILIPRKGTLNNVMYVNVPFWSVDTMFFTEMKVPNVAKYVFHFVKNKDLASLNAGSAVPSMTTDILNAMELNIPDSVTLQKFENIVGTMYGTIQHNNEESKKLATLRDSLLPRLMSGEIDVSSLDI